MLAFQVLVCCISKSTTPVLVVALPRMSMTLYLRCDLAIWPGIVGMDALLLSLFIFHILIIHYRGVVFDQFTVDDGTSESMGNDFESDKPFEDNGNISISSPHYYICLCLHCK